MKENLFSIGNMAKLTGTNIKSLRYYEEIGLLKPEYTDPESKYRYFSYQQIPLITAIKYYIDFGLPLKQFCTHMDGQYLHCDTLIEDSRAIAEDKIRSLKRTIMKIDLAVADMERSKSQRIGVPFSRIMPEKGVLIREIKPASPLQNRTNIGNLLDEAKCLSLDMGFDIGSCCFSSDSITKMYTFMDIHIVEGDKCPESAHFFPAGTYSCVQQKGISVLNAPSFFPEIYQAFEYVLAIETEVFACEYDTHDPLIELRVIGLDALENNLLYIKNHIA
ncbi:MAG: MerR family transcriptional regulator [Clostridiales bacterium]|nr:MerR family transcriptional regulator [Clostridiales bacterium]